MANVAVFVPKPIVDPETGEALGPGCLALLASRVCTCAKEAPAGVDGVQLAATNKYLAQSNKSRTGAEATKKWNRLKRVSGRLSGAAGAAERKTE